MTWAPDDAAINATLRWALTPQLKLQDLGRFLVRLGSHGGPALYLTWDFLLTSMDQVRTT